MSDMITADLVDLDLAAATKEEAARSLARRVVALGRVTDLEGFLADVAAREARMPTGLDGGIGIPHCRSTHVTEPTLAFGRAPEGIDFGAPDGPADLVFLIAAPSGADDAHLAILSALARRLTDTGFTAALRGTASVPTAAALIRGDVEPWAVQSTGTAETGCGETGTTETGAVVTGSGETEGEGRGEPSGGEAASTENAPAPGRARAAVSAGTAGCQPAASEPAGTAQSGAGAEAARAEAGSAATSSRQQHSEDKSRAAENDAARNGTAQNAMAEAGAGPGAGEPRATPFRIVAVASCPTGIAHTYMAAEAIERAGQEAGVEVAVETQGSAGFTRLDPDVVAAADAVIFAHDVPVRDRERFHGKPVVDVGVKAGINRAAELIAEARERAARGEVAAAARPTPVEGAGEPGEGYGTRLRKWLMSGVSYLSQATWRKRRSGASWKKSWSVGPPSRLRRRLQFPLKTSANWPTAWALTSIAERTSGAPPDTGWGLSAFLGHHPQDCSISASRRRKVRECFSGGKALSAFRAYAMPPFESPDRAIIRPRCISRCVANRGRVSGSSRAACSWASIAPFSSPSRASKSDRNTFMRHHGTA
ncbi:fructose PTS transporter subunit IIB [Streptomyces sp. NPDC049910]|uniref:fructose PTS transporter subunit IIB n=1 Tax=Streptomyces sp. NPDC049910 TaxID=3155278 RepID=UPI00344768F9